MAQVRLRAERLGLADAPVQLAAETSVEDIIATLSEGETPRLVVIDSIQTMWTDTVESAPGTVTQVRASAQALIRFAKKSGAALILVGHVTKDGQIAGPRVVEHMVDAVLSFEGDGAHQFRILRAVKNRFGPTDEIGVFEMTGEGLREVANPSALFLSDARSRRPAPPFSPAWKARGRCWWKFRRWSRRPRSAPRAARWSGGIRAASRWCWRCWRRIAGSSSPAMMSILMSRGACASTSLPPTWPPPPPSSRRWSTRRCAGGPVYFGEVSLSGAIRPVAQAGARLKEAAKLGFARACLPEAGARRRAGG